MRPVITKDNIQDLEVLYSIDEYNNFTWSSTGDRLLIRSFNDCVMFTDREGTLPDMRQFKIPDDVPWKNPQMIFPDLDLILFEKESSLYIWSISREKIVYAFDEFTIDNPTSHKPKWSVSPQNRYLGIGYRQFSYLIDLEDHMFYRYDHACMFTFNRDETLAAVLYQGKLVIMELPSTDILGEIDMHNIIILDMKFSADSRYLAVSGETYMNYLMSQAHDPLLYISQEIREAYPKMSISDKISKKISGAPVRLIDLQNPSFTTFQDECEFSAGAVCQSLDGKLLFAGKFDSWSSDNPIVVWDTDSRERLRMIYRYDRDMHQSTCISKLEMNPQGTLLAVDSGYKSRINVLGIPET